MTVRHTLSVAIMAAAVAQTAYGQQLPGLTVPAGGNGVSQRAEVTQWVGPVKISIDYHSPAVHRRGVDRTGHIWGELVPFGFFDDGHGPSTATPWRAGANESTTISLSHNVEIGGRRLAAGTYSLFLEVEANTPWTWIFSNSTGGWGSYQYDPRDDALRVPVAPISAPFTEYLTYGFDKRGPDATTAYLQWENKRVPLDISVPNVNELWVDQMRRELRGWPGFSPDNLMAAAQFCAAHKINLDEALIWAERAIHDPFRGAGVGREDFSTLQTKAAVLEAMGRDSDAAAVMERALQLDGTPAIRLVAYEFGLLSDGKVQPALAVAQRAARQHPEEPYFTHLGLARAYTALGDRPNAIKEWTIAIENIPTAEKANLPEFQKTLTGLRASR
jgi:DUF2911 family protein